MIAVKQGDFTNLSKFYVNRPGYSPTVLQDLGAVVGCGSEEFRIADVGAGTGKLTECLMVFEHPVSCVEPNDAMRKEGENALRNPLVSWQPGSAEETGLAASSVDWVLMGSSFHWTDPSRSLPEFRRILKSGGWFTALWNPRNLEQDPLQNQVQERIDAEFPNIKRKSSGASAFTKDLDRTLTSTGDFTDCIFIEDVHKEVMSRERYLGVWRSVNDIQAQVGKEGFSRILSMIEDEIGDLSEIEVSYKTRAWSVRAL